MTFGDQSEVTGGLARFNNPMGLAVAGNLIYLCDGGNNKMKLLTYNGSGAVTAPGSWYVTDITNGASFQQLEGVAVDGLGNVYVVDDGRANKLYILPQGSSTWTVIAGGGAETEKNGTGLSATFASPEGIAVDQSGIIYVADYEGSLRRVQHTGGSLTDPATWSVSTLVPWGAASVDGAKGTGKVGDLQGVWCADDGTVYLAEYDDIQRLDRTRN
jgi:DNA-binding beta-propeller fold protein YncE